MGSSGLEPPTSRLSGVRSNHLSYEPLCEPSGSGGDERDRTDDPLLAKQVLSQLSYTPINGSRSFGVHTHALEPQKLNNDIEFALSFAPSVSFRRADLEVRSAFPADLVSIERR